MIPLEQSATPSPAQPSGSVKSPGLDQFRNNPFRVLRLPVAATSTQAVWKGEKALTLARAGMPLPGDDPLPWLQEPDEIEIQEAAQKMEEPLRRLVEQLFWFDFDQDPAGALLYRALRGDSTALSAALSIPEPKAPVPSDTPHLINDERTMSLIGRINQANLRLIAALAAMHNIGPRLAASSPAARTKIGSSPAKSWTEIDGIPIVVNAHEALEKRRGDTAHPYEALLGQALSRWAAILGDVALPSLLRHLIRCLDDDLVTVDDTETLSQAARTLLADILAGEIKACTLAGQMDRTTSLARIAGESGLSPQVWIQALKPLRYVFRSEVDDLAGIITGPALPSIENVRLYLKRVAVLSDRWSALDASNLLGLAQTIDEGVLLAYERIQSIRANLSVEERLGEGENLNGVLTAAVEVAHSESLKERLRTAKKQIEQARAYICHFCRKREASDFPTVLRGEKVIDRNWVANTVTYRRRWTLVHRCEICADLHNFFVLDVPLTILIVTWIIGGISVGVCSMLLSGPEVLLLGALSAVVASAFFTLVGGAIMSRMLTPQGDRHYKNVSASAGWQSLINDGYGGVLFPDITICSGKHAIDSAPKRSR